MFDPEPGHETGTDAAWTDLTQPIDEAVVTRPPDHPDPRFEDYATYEADGYNSTILHLETHCGTHMDAATHMFPTADYGDSTIETVTPADMLTEGVVLDVSDVSQDAAIKRERIDRAIETAGVTVHDGDVVFLDTGFDPTAPDVDVETYRHEYAYPSVDAAEFLVSAGAGVVAVDTLGVDPPGATIAEHHVHRTLLSAGVRIVEGVANLSTLDSGRYGVICTPLPYVGRDGSQVRLLVRPKAP